MTDDETRRLIAEVLWAGFKAHGLTGEISVEMGEVATTTYVGKPSKNDLILSVRARKTP